MDQEPELDQRVISDIEEEPEPVVVNKHMKPETVAYNPVTNLEPANIDLE